MTPRNGRRKAPARELVEFKFVVQAILLVKNDGKVVGEQVTDPQTLYGTEAVQEFIDLFPQRLLELEAQIVGPQFQRRHPVPVEPEEG